MGERLPREIKAFQNSADLKLLRGKPFFTRAHLRSSRRSTTSASPRSLASTILFSFFFFLSFFGHGLSSWMRTATSSKSMQMCECMCNGEGGRGPALFGMSKLGLLCVNPQISFRMTTHFLCHFNVCPHAARRSTSVRLVLIRACVFSLCMSGNCGCRACNLHSRMYIYVEKGTGDQRTSCNKPAGNNTNSSTASH